MNNHNVHLWLHQVRKRKEFVVVRLTCISVLAISITAISLVMAVGFVQAHAVTPVDHSRFTANTPCHSDVYAFMVKDYKYPLMSASQSQTQIGTLEIQMWYCYLYHSAFVRFIYTNGSQPLTGYCTLTGYKIINGNVGNVENTLPGDGKGCIVGSGLIPNTNGQVDTQAVEGTDLAGEFSEAWSASWIFATPSLFSCKDGKNGNALDTVGCTTPSSPPPAVVPPVNGTMTPGPIPTPIV